MRLAQRSRLNRHAIHLSSFCRDQPGNFFFAAMLSQAYAAIGEKDSALKVAERTIMILPRAKDPLGGPGIEENLAFIQTVCGENSRAISTLTQLLKTPYRSWDDYFTTPITPALLRLDPLWDPLRADPALPKTLRGKAEIISPRITRIRRIAKARGASVRRTESRV